MLGRWIRDLWGKHTEKKALAPAVRDMLVDLDGVYEQKPTDARRAAGSEQQLDVTQKA